MTRNFLYQEDLGGLEEEDFEENEELEYDEEEY